MVSSRCPRAAARVIALPEDWVKSVAAGNHRVHRTDPGDFDRLHLDAVLLPEIEIVGEITEAEGKPHHRHRHYGFFELALLGM